MDLWHARHFLPWLLLFCLTFRLWRFESGKELTIAVPHTFTGSVQSKRQIMLDRRLDQRPCQSNCSGSSPEIDDESNVRGSAHIVADKRQKRTDRMEVLSERVTAAMTLGAVAFQMSLFYTIHHPDGDMRRYSYSIIGQTISIFCAVLTFSALYGLIEEQVHKADLTKKIILFPSLILLSFLMMETTVMLSVRVRSDHLLRRAKSGTRELKIPEHVLNGKTYGAVAAQLCGAAVVRGVGHLQFLAYEEYKSPSLVLFLCTMGFFGLFVVAHCCALIRGIRIMWDEVVDSIEETWIKVAEECEDEVIALSSGFFFAVYIRVIVTDSLPYMLLHGWEHRKTLEVARTKDVFYMWLVGSACVVTCITINVGLFGVLDREINMEKLRRDSLSRLCRLLTLTLGMVFAWCLIFGTHLLALHLLFVQEDLKLRLYLALFQSMLAFAVIYVLDFFADLAGPAYANAIVMTIHCLGVSVGLSWEHAFHRCVEVCVNFMAEDNSLFSASDSKEVWACCLSAVIVITVLPAFRFYIVPRMYELIEEYEDKVALAEITYRQEIEEASGPPMQQYLFHFGRESSALETAQD